MHRAGRGRSRTAVLAVLALLLTACGARLTDEQRLFAIEIAAGIGGPVEDSEAPPEAAGPAVPTPDPTAPTRPDPEALADPAPGIDPGGQPLVPDPATTDQPGPDQPGPDQPPPPTQPNGGQVDTRAAPPGGNGGATDDGVFEDRIVIANVSDVTGAVQGLFEDTRLAVRAYVEMFNATEGTIYGRRLHYLPLDARLDTRGNQESYTRACDDAFAAVGSMSAFEQGGAPAIRECGLPDVRAAAVTEQIMALDTVYPADSRAIWGLQPVADYRYWAEAYPEAVKRAGYLYIDAETTRAQTSLVRAGTEEIGYEWVVYEGIDLAETNYDSFVIRLRNHDVRYLAFQGAYQQAVRLAEAMRRQSYWPEVYALQANAYTPDFLELGRTAIDGTQIAINTVMFEEIDQHPELQRYAQWLNHVSPGTRPTGLGMYAWSAAMLFVETAKAVGPELTREKLIQELRKVDNFTGNGLLPPQHVGQRVPSACTTIIEVRDARFHRVEPAAGFRCRDWIDVR